jgi:hypothetical protein
MTGRLYADHEESLIKSLAKDTAFAVDYLKYAIEEGDQETLIRTLCRIARANGLNIESISPVDPELRETGEVERHAAIDAVKSA